MSDLLRPPPSPSQSHWQVFPSHGLPQRAQVIHRSEVKVHKLHTASHHFTAHVHKIKTTHPPRPRYYFSEPSPPNHRASAHMCRRTKRCALWYCVGVPVSGCVEACLAVCPLARPGLPGETQSASGFTTHPHCDSARTLSNKGNSLSQFFEYHTVW